MRNPFDSKVVKQKKLDKECSVKISKNGMGQRIFVEFSTTDGKFVIQKSFQDTFEGRELAKEFQKSIRNIKDLRKYLGLK